MSKVICFNKKLIMKVLFVICLIYLNQKANNFLNLFGNLFFMDPFRVFLKFLNFHNYKKMFLVFQ